MTGSYSIRDETETETFFTNDLCVCVCAFVCVNVTVHSLCAHILLSIILERACAREVSWAQPR